MAQVEGSQRLHATVWHDSEVTLELHLGWAGDDVVETKEGELAEEKFLNEIGHALHFSWQMFVHDRQRGADSGC